MGRERVIKQLNKVATRMIVVGSIVGILFVLFAFVLFVAEVPGLAIFVAVMALIMFILPVIGITKKKNIMNCMCFKLNPKLLDQADELFSDIIYQDNLIICSNRIVASAKDITQMAAFDEIIDISASSMSYNGVTTQHELIIYLQDYEMKINIYGKSKKTVEELRANIIQHCPQLQNNALKERWN